MAIPSWSQTTSLALQNVNTTLDTNLLVVLKLRKQTPIIRAIFSCLDSNISKTLKMLVNLLEALSSCKMHSACDVVLIIRQVTRTIMISYKLPEKKKRTMSSRTGLTY